MKKNRKIYMFIICMLLCSGCARDSLQYVEENVTQTETGNDSASETAYVQEDTITVHICGEVYFPGVYTVYEGSRIYEVVRQAGGFTKDADTEGINQAKKVSDGEQIYIPSVSEKEENLDTDGLIDINKADEAQLCTIPGIGETRAKQIIEYRDRYGSFQTIEDIVNVTGIKEGIFEKIAPYITVS